jgi:hypothetical protein
MERTPPYPGDRRDAQSFARYFAGNPPGFGIKSSLEWNRRASPQGGERRFMLDLDHRLLRVSFPDPDVSDGPVLTVGAVRAGFRLYDRFLVADTSDRASTFAGALSRGQRAAKELSNTF